MRIVLIGVSHWHTPFYSEPVLAMTDATIVGVSPPGFVGANVGSSADITVPLAAFASVNRMVAEVSGPGNFWLRVLARPAPVEVPQLQAEGDGVAGGETEEGDSFHQEGSTGSERYQPRAPARGSRDSPLAGARDW